MCCILTYFYNILSISAREIDGMLSIADTFLSGANGISSEIFVQQYRESQVSQPAGKWNKGDTRKSTGQ